LWFSDNFRIDVLTFWHGFWVLVACCLLLVVQKLWFLCLFNFFFLPRILDFTRMQFSFSPILLFTLSFVNTGMLQSAL
jgi:hypothetical protein